MDEYDNTLISFGIKPVVIFGLSYPSAFHAYHAAKYLIYDMNGRIIESPVAKQIRLQQDINPKHIVDNKRWERNKYNIMRYIIYKFLITYDTPMHHTLTHFFTTDNKYILETLSVLDNKLMPLAPTANSNWNIPNHLLSSAIPSEENIRSLVKAGVNVMVNLDIKDKIDYETHLGFKYTVNTKDDYITFYLPIGEHKRLSDLHLIKMAMLIIHLIGTNKCVVVYCNDDNGRTGTLISLVLGILYGLTKDQVISMISRHYELRMVKKQDQVMEMSLCQLQQINRILNDSLAHPGAWLV